MQLSGHYVGRTIIQLSETLRLRDEKAITGTITFAGRECSFQGYYVFLGQNEALRYITLAGR